MKERYFTLIELLVVIAILASLLLPTLNQARDKGRTTVCTGNLKQIGSAIGIYQSDFNDYFPKGILSKTEDNCLYYWTWAFCDLKYLRPNIFFQGQPQFMAVRRLRTELAGNGRTRSR